MPSILNNVRRWKQTYDWSNRGTEWCDGFGGVEKAWTHAILPRIETFLPTGHILELGPGYGVWTDFLQPFPPSGQSPLSERMTLVDLAPNCIKFCRKRFGKPNMAYHTNDGTSLSMVELGSIDFVFSFNSLVHADHAVMREYVRQLGTKMKPGSFGFIHHSNLGEYEAEFDAMEKGHDHWRGRDMTGEKFRADCRDAGLVCVFQEIIPWGSPRFIDALSLFAKPLPGQELPERVERNPDFWHQARAGDHAPAAWYVRPT
ncbi:MAG: class I SAM-dependent methyltransferase [Planctomycetota bacterium]|nr:class I SAM-dependent methyltransferase [Planctomycetota bacterium]